MNRDGDIAAVILAEAAELYAGVIVLGTRGLGGVKSLMLGSVSRTRSFITPTALSSWFPPRASLSNAITGPGTPR